ncbi:MAG TPA: RNA 2',3'-cyclic phosphodiesterase [Bacillales bacterium]|nr:RNA 2',3'-cyclic phosphodiesterase [Bacillales bacterium]
MADPVAHYFFAVPVPEPVRSHLHAQSQTLRKHLPYKQWTHRDDYHLTLAFLGAVADNRIETFTHEAAQVAGQSSPFSLAINGIGTFGTRERPRVLWAGVREDERLHVLQKGVAEASKAAGYEPDRRPYRPHITLAKKWNGTETIDRNVLPNGFHSAPWTVDAFILYRIDRSNFPKYFPLRTFAFSR